MFLHLKNGQAVLGLVETIGWLNGDEWSNSCALQSDTVGRKGFSGSTNFRRPGMRLMESIRTGETWACNVARTIMFQTYELHHKASLGRQEDEALVEYVPFTRDKTDFGGGW